jgi:hypothetical protein
MKMKVSAIKSQSTKRNALAEAEKTRQTVVQSLLSGFQAILSILDKGGTIKGGTINLSITEEEITVKIKQASSKRIEDMFADSDPLKGIEALDPKKVPARKPAKRSRTKREWY